MASLTLTPARRVALIGPAFIAAVAYVDPGNVATNVTAGARFGYTLVWVVVMANAMAVLVQYLSAKLGMVTGASCRPNWDAGCPALPRIAYWLQAEVVAIATDMAEVVGGAIASEPAVRPSRSSRARSSPLAVGLLILRIGDVRGQSALERTIMAFLGLIAVGFLAGLFVNPPQPGPLASGLIPHFAGTQSLLLASGIIGATVMPHVIYLHSSLTVTRLDGRGDGLSVRDLLSVTRTDVVLALILAGILNLSLLVVAAASLQGRPGTDTLSGVHAVITSDLGAGVALLFAVALLGSGLASTSVGSAAGAEVMRGLLHLQIPMTVRRIVTVIPAVVVLALGFEPSAALVVSQVVLSMGIPLALVPLVLLTASRSVMGEHANHRLVNVGAWTVATIVISLNVTLLWLTFVG